MKNLNRFVISLIALTLLCGCAHKSGHLKKEKEEKCMRRIEHIGQTIGR